MQTISELSLPTLPMEEPDFSENPWPHLAAARQQHSWLATCAFGYVVHQYDAMRDLLWLDHSMTGAYDNVVDLSVYVARERRGRGIGDSLLGALEQRARRIGYHKMVLAAFPTNAPGMRLYERHGFQTVGIYHEQGMLDGRWVDVIVMEKILG